MGCGNVVWPERFSRNIDLALIACLTSSNSSLYIALCSNYGDASDAGAISVFCIKDGPFVTMMVLGVSGLANIPFAALLSMLIPLLIGMLWGNLDERFKQLCTGAAAGDHYYVVRHRRQLQYQYGVHRRAVRDPVGDYLRANRDCVLLYLQPVFEEEKRAGRRAGNHRRQLGADAGDGCPADHSLAMYVDAATAQLATASIITMITAPILVAWFDKRLKKRAPAAEPLKEVKSEESVTLSSPAAKGHK